MSLALRKDLSDSKQKDLASDWANFSPQVELFPSTRFMGSKEKLLSPLWYEIGKFGPQSVLDLCSGSGVVSYMLKAQGCQVFANDYMSMATTISKALIKNSCEKLSRKEIDKIRNACSIQSGLIYETYKDLYYFGDDLNFLDGARIEIQKLEGAKQSIAMAALIRACIKRRPRGIFTYTGNRYDDGRKDLKISLREHFENAATEINEAVFSNNFYNEVFNIDLSHAFPDVRPDVVYLDPPYFSPLSDNEYVRRYHFTEALARDWEGVEIQTETKTKKIKNYPSPFRSEIGCRKAISEIAETYSDSVLVISYSSNSLPTCTEIISLLKRHKKNVSLKEVDYRYSFANQSAVKKPVKNKVKELIFTAY